MVEISVIVPVYNNSATIGACLRALDTQSLPRDQYEVIIVDDGSLDRSPDKIQQHSVKFVQQAHRGAASARNTGAREARGRWLAYTDADCLPSQHWLKSLLAAVNTSNDVWGAAGKTIGYLSQSDAARFVDLTGGLDAATYLIHPFYPWAPTCNTIIRRDLFDSLGGLDERFACYEYCDFHLRLRQHFNLEFRYVPRAVILHHHRATWRAYWRQQLGYGQGYGQLLWKHRELLRWNWQHEVRTWGQLTRSAISAAWPQRGDRALVRRGLFVKQFAQHLGFIRAYYNPAERARWQAAHT